MPLKALEGRVYAVRIEEAEEMHLRYARWVYTSFPTLSDFRNRFLSFLTFRTFIHKLESSAVPSHVRFYEPYNSQLDGFRLSVFRYHFKSMTDVHLIYYRDVRVIKVYELESYYHRSKPKEIW